jgi:hypothetical protein
MPIVEKRKIKKVTEWRINVFRVKKMNGQEKWMVRKN